jgi:uncharacterized protein (TIGR02246 family)
MAPGLLTAQTTDTLPAQVATKQIDAFNRRDLDGFMALYAEDAVVAEFPSGKILWAGKPAIREGYAGMFKANTTPPVRVPTRVVDGAFVVDYEEWDAKAEERNHATWMYEIRGGLIRRGWTVRM